MASRQRDPFEHIQYHASSSRVPHDPRHLASSSASALLPKPPIPRWTDQSQPSPAQNLHPSSTLPPSTQRSKTQHAQTLGARVRRPCLCRTHSGRAHRSSAYRSCPMNRARPPAVRLWKSQPSYVYRRSHRCSRSTPHPRPSYALLLLTIVPSYLPTLNLDLYSSRSIPAG